MHVWMMLKRKYTQEIFLEEIDVLAMKKLSLSDCNRFHHVDLLECLGIFMVLLYHTKSNVDYDVSSNTCLSTVLHYGFRALLSSCVSLFFLCNGFLLFNHRFDLKRHILKLIRLILLSLIWSFICTIWGAYVLDIVPSNWSDILKTTLFLDSYANIHIWFLQTLAILYMVFPILKIVYDRSIAVFKYFFTLLAIIIVENQILGILTSLILKVDFVGYNFFLQFNPFTIKNAYALFFFVCGGCLSFYHSRILLFIKVNRYRFLFVCITMLVLSTLSLVSYGLFITKNSNTLWDVVGMAYGSIFTIFNVLCFYIISLFFCKKGFTPALQIITLISKNTFGIYLLQCFVTQLYNVMLSNYCILDSSLLTFFLYVSITFIILFICLYLSISLKNTSLFFLFKL